MMTLGRALDTGSTPAGQRMAVGITSATVFETGDSRYQWLNPVQAAGKGIMSADLSRIDYEIYELR